MRHTIEERQRGEKERLIEQLRKTPIVQIACKKSDVSRATYYRWRNDDKDFAKNADEALVEGATLVNDMAESQLLSAIQDKNMTAIIFWLKHHHTKYATKVEVTANINSYKEALTPEQQEVVTRALTLSGITEGEMTNA